MIDFQPVINSESVPGLVLRLEEENVRYFRLTHVFKTCVYGMWVSEPQNARHARRPVRKTTAELKSMAHALGATWGKIALPAIFSEPPLKGSFREEALSVAWGLVNPLLQLFEKEANLARSNFTALIRARADATDTSFINLLRMVLRYYYFGRTRLALIPLTPGTKPGEVAYRLDTSASNPEFARPKRRGRQPILADELGENQFIVSDGDISDMVASLESLLRKGPTFLTEAHEKYLGGPFSRRNPQAYGQYVAKKSVEPVTLRQFRYYVSQNAQFSAELAQNLRKPQRNSGYLGSLRSNGPGEVFEIDSTGGRFQLVSSSSPTVLLGTPTIYLLIDRWSRYIPSVYVSLRSPSYEEVRYALLIAFTSRVKRFKALGVDIDDERWPVGNMPAELCPDRGSDFLSASMEQALVADLRIDLTPLPPYCPDGKAIVERFIREVKRRMAGRKVKGVFADRPLDPHTRRAFREAKLAAVHSLADAYRLLIEIVHDHNTRPHSSLRRRRLLTQAGVAPTPKDAYLWGLKNLSGLRKAPLTDEDYRRMLLSTDTASIANGVLKYKSRPYLPVNEIAKDLAASSTRRAKQLDVRLDKTDPQEISVPTARGAWGLFRITPGGANELAGLSLEEEDVLASQNARLWARAENDSRIRRLETRSNDQRSKKPRASPAETISKAEQLKARANETKALKQALNGTSEPMPVNVEKRNSSKRDWVAQEEQERLQKLALIRKHRRKQ